MFDDLSTAELTSKHNCTQQTENMFSPEWRKNWMITWLIVATPENIVDEMSSDIDRVGTLTT